MLSPLAISWNMCHDRFFFFSSFSACAPVSTKCIGMVYRNLFVVCVCPLVQSSFIQQVSAFIHVIVWGDQRVANSFKFALAGNQTRNCTGMQGLWVLFTSPLSVRLVRCELYCLIGAGMNYYFFLCDAYDKLYPLVAVLLFIFRCSKWCCHGMPAA